MKRSPQEKKSLSLTRDRRNTYGESPHGAGKSIPRNKRIRARAERRAAAVPVAEALSDEAAIDLATARAERRRKKSWQKLPDPPLRAGIPANKAGARTSPQ